VIGLFLFFNTEYRTLRENLESNYSMVILMFVSSRLERVQDFEGESES
jgi:hypothetical protein